MAEEVVDVFIAVGSNIDPEQNIRAALERLKRHVHVTAVSTFYRTAPLAGRDQAFYLNGVWRAQTSRSARRLKFDVLRPLEVDLGRTRTEDKYAARTIDLDLIVYGDRVIDEPDLRTPDPDLRVRPFIAVPLLELAPDFVLPDSGEPLASLPVCRSPTGLQAVRAFTRRLRRSITT